MKQISLAHLALHVFDNEIHVGFIIQIIVIDYTIIFLLSVCTTPASHGS